MAIAIGRAQHDERLSVVDHLEELRTRLIISLVAIAVAFGFCVSQNHALLQIMNKPLAQQTRGQMRTGNGLLGTTYKVQQSARVVGNDVELVVRTLARPGSGVSAPTRASLRGLLPKLQQAVARLAGEPDGSRPVTLGVGEPFTATIGVALLFAFLLAFPIVLYEAYSFLLPAFSPQRQRVAASLVLAIPVLFTAGVLFGYAVVLPAALHFLANFNSGEFTIFVQASQYYRFAALTMLAMGLLFQVPVGVLAATGSGVTTSGQLRRNRRYALLACGLVAALLPGDMITLLLETVPLYLLFELSVLLAALAERRSAARFP